MPITFTELLPASKTVAHRALKYTPACRRVGVLELTDSKVHVRYALAVQPFGGVRLTKAGGSENYVATATTCECRGFVLGGKVCKHVEAVRALLENDWLDHDGREAVGDKFEDADERDAFYASGRG